MSTTGSKGDHCQKQGHTNPSVCKGREGEGGLWGVVGWGGGGEVGVHSRQEKHAVTRIQPHHNGGKDRDRGWMSG